MSCMSEISINGIIKMINYSHIGVRSEFDQNLHKNIFFGHSNRNSLSKVGDPIEILL